jgi:hypothetical protein
VASNKVGHFIYGLRDRIWPDFVCHFSLFKGVHPSISGFQHSGLHDGLQSGSQSWRATDQNLVVAQRAPTLFQPNLDILIASAKRDFSSAKELAKFGFVRGIPTEDVPCSSSAAPVGSPDCSPPVAVRFGSFAEPVTLANQLPSNARFFNDNFVRKLCAGLSKETLEHLEVLRLAKYSEADIMEILKLPLIPPKDLVYQFIGSCYRCGLKDHIRKDCPGVCLGCQQLGSRCHVCVFVYRYLANQSWLFSKMWRLRVLSHTRP